MSSVRKQAISAVIWSTVQRFGSLVISFVANIILARLLTPRDFGTVGIFAVFIAIAQSFVDGGFTAALIQRKNVTNIDYTSVFYWNVFLGMCLAIILFFSAPFIASFYADPVLTPILRVQSLTFLIVTFSIVQTARLLKELRFKTLAIRNLASVLVGSIVAIIMAYTGYGVWSLVVKEVVGAIVGAILLWSICSWRPTWNFNFSSLKSMMKFGSTIFISSVTDTLYTNVQSLIIGKCFSLSDLGYYSQAKKLDDIPSTSINSILQQVLFPVFSKISDNYDYMKSIVRKNMTIISFVIFPIMILLIIIAKPLIIILFSEKWEPSIPLFQILCVYSMFAPLNTANTQIFKALGRGDVFLILQVGKRMLCIVLIFLSIQYGLYAMMYTIAATGLIFYAINIYFTHRVFRYTLMEQLADITPSFLTALITGGLIYYIVRILTIHNNYIEVLIAVLSYGILYIGFSYSLRIKGIINIISIIKSR